VRHTFPGGTFIASTVNFTASAQVRAGVLATPSLLLYGQTGVSAANQRLQINFGGPVTDVSQLTPGFTAGFGAEWKPAGVLPAGTSLFAAYEHTWWDKARLDTPVAAPLSNYTWQRQSDAVKAGFRIHFGAPPPAPPAYMPVKAPRSK
jgi:opacity protein-like surface antigen